MNQAVAKAQKASKTGRKPLAIVEKDEKKQFDKFCAQLAEIQAEQEANAERLLAARKVHDADKEAVALGDLQGLLKLSQSRVEAPAQIEAPRPFPRA